MLKQSFIAGVGALTLAIGANVTAAPRDTIGIVGSSTVYPFATVVAEHFGNNTKYPTPKIESTGSGGGLQLFCQGVGVNTPDITNASRRIKQSEVDLCRKNGVKDIVEVKIGRDGIVLANSRQAKQFDLSLKDIYLALAKRVPDPQGGQELVDNPYKTWHDVNSDLPKTQIQVYGPPPTSGTRDAFVELAMEGGCAQIDWIKAMKESDEDKFKRTCGTMREDGAFIEAGENDNLIVQKLEANKNSQGIFGFSFLEQNRDAIQGAKIGGAAPTFEDISADKYALARPLFFYVKKAHVGVIPGIQEYLAEWTKPSTWGEDGYLSDRGLIPLPKDLREKWAQKVNNLAPLDLASK